MARLVLTPLPVVATGYPTLPLTALSADFAFTAAGANFADGAGFAHTGREIIIAKGGAAPQTITITSIPDDKKRSGNITTYAIGIGLFSVFGPFPVDGWRQSDGQLYLAASATDVSFAVLKLPAIS